MSRPVREETVATAARGDLTHVDSAGRVHMVDVTGKPWTERSALARCRVTLGDAGDITCERGGGRTHATAESKWSELFSAARLSGIQAAKHTATLIPLCHPLTVSDVEVRLSLGENCVEIEAVAQVSGPTGVEMEALTACGVAALTIVAAVSPTSSKIAIEDLALWEKSGGRSGNWKRDTTAPRLLASVPDRGKHVREASWRPNS